VQHALRWESPKPHAASSPCHWICKGFRRRAGAVTSYQLLTLDA
jgi:hypothetical protein